MRVAAGAADSRERFRLLVVPLLDDVYTLARYLARDASEAEDAAQECLERALRYFDGFAGGGVKPWLFAILRNVLRSRRPAPFEPLPDEEAASGAATDPLWDGPADLEADLVRLDEAAHLRRLIGRLPLAHREALILKEFHGLSYREIAEVTSVPIGTVMSRLARAREALQAAWRAFESKGVSP
jgi:RNA polymerase sigma-70 factor (ECF subfamily)